MSIQIDDGEFTRLHNTIFEKLAVARFTASEYRCLFFLFRTTYGWQKKEDAISLSQWAKGTGIDPEKRANVLRTLRGLVAKRVIYTKSNGNNHMATWGFNKHFEQWDASLFHETVITQDNREQPSVITTDNTTVITQDNSELPSVIAKDNSELPSVIAKDNSTVISHDNETVITADNHKRKKETIKESREEKEETHAHDPLLVAWQQAYTGVDMPTKLAASLRELVSECGMAATIHGIKASAVKEGGRNFRYIAECARNYVPPAPMASYANGNPYTIDIPGIVELPATKQTAPVLPTPMAHDDPWTIALAELSAVLPGSAPRWLAGSSLKENGELAGVPFYRVTLVCPEADPGWLRQQAEPAIRKKLASLLGKRIALEIVNPHKEYAA